MPRVPPAIAGPMTGMTPESTPRPASAPRPRPVSTPVIAPVPASRLVRVRASVTSPVGHIPGVVAHRDADLIVPEPSPAEFVNRSIGLETVVEHADDGRLLGHHVVLLAELERQPGAAFRRPELRDLGPTNRSGDANEMPFPAAEPGRRPTIFL